MSNMSYCRFHNTLADLRDVSEHIFDDDLSKEENRARKRLIKLCYEIAQDFMDFDNDGDLDEEAINSLQED